MSATVLIKKINSLPTAMQLQVADFVEFLLEKNRKKTISTSSVEPNLSGVGNENLSLEAAADLMLEYYLHDEELTALTALDTEDFYESK